MFSKTIALAVFTATSFGFGVLLFAQPKDVRPPFNPDSVLPPSKPDSATPDSPSHPSPPPKVPVLPFEFEPPLPPLDLPGKAGARQPAPPDVDERRARKERLAAMRKKLSEFQRDLKLPEEWRAVRDSLDSIIAAIRSDDSWPRKAAVQFARATVVALLADEEDKQALASKKRLLLLLQRDAKAPKPSVR